MQIIKNATTRTSAVLLAIASLLPLNPQATHADGQKDSQVESAMKINAGTTFRWIYDANGNPLHEVRGVVQVSNLGNCRVYFLVGLAPAAVCGGSHLFCVSGTMTITTLAGDELQTSVIGMVDPDPSDTNPIPNMYKLHYDVTITGGTGKLQGASGDGKIDGVGAYCGADCFCDGYIGTATWLYQGVLHLPRP